MLENKEFPLISFIMPVYNDGAEVEKAIDSIFDNDWPSIEVIAVNDGSTDNSKEALAKLSKKHKNLTVVNFERNKGACAARNEGAKLAKGKYYAWLPADAKIYPGMVRVWVETLEKHSDYDFLYGGYRFVDDQGNTVMNYPSQKFEPYLLEVQNYIDGSFPLKAETFWRVAKEMGQDGLWDPNIKSLQDWDFWLSVVKHGGKGFYYADTFFETTLPHPGGLSYDSHENWLARSNAIKRKHGIPDRKICVTAPGAPFFAKYLAWVLDADFKDLPPLKDHDYDMIYLLGFYPSMAERCSMSFVHPKYFSQYEEFIKEGKEVPMTAALKVVHLIGTDLLQMADLSKNQLGVFQHFLNNKFDHTFTEFEPTQKEAKELGLNTNVLALPPRMFFEPTSFPKEFTIAVYAPPVNQALYNLELMEKVAKKLPKVKFKFFGGQAIKRDGNIEYVGYVNDMTEFIKDCSCLMRITTHDGLPQAVLEFLSAGRRIIFNHDFKFVNTANKQLTVNALLKAIKEEMDQDLNEESAKWVRKNFSHEKFKEKVYSLLEYKPKEFWEKYAQTWIKGAEKFYDTRDWAEIEPFVKEIDPSSVIDIGCGTGQWSQHFKKGYFGIDISENLIKFAQKEYPDRKFKASSLEDLDVGKKYDLAFCYTVFEHITEENMPKAIASLKKVAKKAILVEPIDIKTKQYCHNHNYSQWFKIKKSKDIRNRRLMVIDL